MKNHFHEISLQVVSRLFALTIPLLVVFYFKQKDGSLTSDNFFEILTDSVFVLAIFKLGVDSYIPSCSLKDNKIVVAGAYIALYNSISLLFLGSFFLFLLNGIELYFLLVVPLVMQAILFAEIGRIQGYYSVYYLFKAPSVYLFAAYTALFLNVKILLILSVLIFVISVYANRKYILPEEGEFSSRSISLATLVSLLTVVLSWKEASIARYFGHSVQLSELVFYTRLKVVITFLFMIYNARIPNILRENTEERSKDLISIVRNSRAFSLSWALFCSIVFIILVWFFDPENTLFATIIFLSTFVFIFTGNVIPVLIYFRKYSALILNSIISLSIFYIICVVEIFGQVSLLKIAIAGLISQIVLCALMIASINQLQRLLLFDSK